MTPDQTTQEQPSPRRTEQLQPDMAAVRSKVMDLEHQARTLIRQQPVVAVLAAVGMGFLVARLVSRRTS